MHILLIVPSVSRSGGGVSEVVRLLARGLVDLSDNARVTVLTLRDEFLNEDSKDWSNVEIIACRSYGPRIFGFSPSLLVNLFRVRPDVVHVHALWMFHCLAALIWSLLTRKRYIVTPHGMLEPWILKRSPRLKWLVSVLYQNWFLRRASCFQVLTEKELQDVRAFVGNRPARTIPNYVSLDQQGSLGRPPWWNDQFTGRDIHLYFGRIHEKKGCIELCQAWEQLCSSDDRFCRSSVLVFCGWIDALADFQTKIDELRTRFGNIFFAGPQYGIAKLESLAAASFFVLPSKSEGLPMVVLEAWANSKPILMTRECNLSIGFERGAAIEVRPTVPSLVQSLSAASQLTQEQRSAIGSRGRELVNENYSKQFVIDQLQRLYRDLSNDGSRLPHSPSQALS